MSWRVTEAGAVRNAKEWSFAPGLVARYAFHFQLAKKFGGVVGTELGLTYEGGNLGKDVLPAECGGNGFRPGPSILFPSMLLGVVQNYLEDRRFLVLGQYGAAWFPVMKTCAGIAAKHHSVDAIPHHLSLMGQFDLFSSTSAAWSVGAGLRSHFIKCVGTVSVCELGAQKASLLERLKITGWGFFFVAGVTWPTGADSIWR